MHEKGIEQVFALASVVEQWISLRLFTGSESWHSNRATFSTDGTAGGLYASHNYKETAFN